MPYAILKVSTLLAFTVCVQLSTACTAQESDKTAPSTTPKVELLEAGKAPLQKLRFTPKAGETSWKMMKMKISQALGDAEPQPMPEQQVVIKMEIKNVSANGDIDFEFTYTDIKVVTADGKPSAIATSIEQAIKPLVGTGATAKTDNRGMMISSDYKVPEGLAPMIKTAMEGMKDAIKNLSVPLPEEAVGVGAKWKTVQPFNANGMQLDQITHSELTEVNSKGFALKVTVTQDAKPQEVKNALLPEGTSLKLESLDTTGGGSSEFVFTELLPKKASTHVQSKTNMNIQVGQRTQKLATNMTVEMVLEDTPAK